MPQNSPLILPPARFGPDLQQLIYRIGAYSTRNFNGDELGITMKLRFAATLAEAVSGRLHIRYLRDVETN